MASDAGVARALEEAAESLLVLATALRTKDRNGRNLGDRIRDAQVGQLRSPTIDAGASTAPQKPDTDVPPELRGRPVHSDPTGAAAVDAATNGDTARLDLDRITKAAPRLAKEAAALVDIARRYNPRTANVIEQQTDQAEPGCESCSRIPGPGTAGGPRKGWVPWWNPVARQVTLADGSSSGLCEWCRAWVRGHDGVLPSVDVLSQYRDTGRVRRAG